ncbi:RNB domain-containing ribonuclease [Nocardia asteroides]|uniref:RNB domain-containing ribonuclease n=1 Tax=Nocardia asteroides TaxID=1824 RepID=UPI001E370349|nr:RNB domain-containing ribonuclease [Nocardia asteroides]UGT60616.1 RNB domain-containing ribonuclease [Nocardia asteroides]
MELHRRIRSAPAGFGAVRAEFDLPTGYPDAAVTEARDAIDAFAGLRRDRTDLAFVTIDPPGAMDLDQAVHLTRGATGFTLHYAIADVAAVVRPDGALAAETRSRGQTYYLPDGTVPLHPPVLSEGAASLLPDVDRPVALWTVELDEHAAPRSYRVERALIRSRARLDYAGVQAAADAGTLPAAIAGLPEFGALRIEAGLERGAIALRLPAQSVVADDGVSGHWKLELEPRTAADDWNEQVLLLVGMCAARIMLDSPEPVGLLRTMPAPPDSAVAAMRRTAAALGVAWPAEQPVGRMLAGLDPNTPAGLVLNSEATTLLRGAAYTVFGVGAEPAAPPADPDHSGLGAPYAHVTAPLRRLSDRFTTEICLARCAGTDIPDWVHTGLTEAANAMKRSDSVANKVDRACVDLTEAALLAPRIGAEFDAVVLREAAGAKPAEIFVADPPILAPCTGEPPEGARVGVRLIVADPAARQVRFGYPAP